MLVVVGVPGSRDGRQPSHPEYTTKSILAVFRNSFQGIRIFHVHAQGTEYIQIFRLHMTDHSLLFLVSGVNQQVKALRFTLAHGAFRNLAVMACINFFDCDGPWSVTL